MLFYLAGPFIPYKSNKDQEYEDWRDYVIENVKKEHSFIDPRNNNQDSPMFFAREDTKSVIKSDGVLLYRPSAAIENIGGNWEHGIACGYSESGKKKIPTIYVDEKMLPFPPIMASAKRTFTKLEAAIVYLNLLDSWKNEMTAIYAYLDWEDNYFKDLKNEKTKKI
jgi:hypothetical protein